MIFHVWFFCLFDMNKHRSKQGRECFILTEFDLRFVSFFFSPQPHKSINSQWQMWSARMTSACWQKEQTLNLHGVSFCCQICQNDRYPKDTYDTLQFSSLWHHPSIENKKKTSRSSIGFCGTLPFSFCWSNMSNIFHIWMDHGRFRRNLHCYFHWTYQDLSSFSPGDGRQTSEPALEPPVPPHRKLQNKKTTKKNKPEKRWMQPVCV